MGEFVTCSCCEGEGVVVPNRFEDPMIVELRKQYPEIAWERSNDEAGTRNYYILGMRPSADGRSHEWTLYVNFTGHGDIQVTRYGAGVYKAPPVVQFSEALKVMEVLLNTSREMRKFTWG